MPLNLEKHKSKKMYPEVDDDFELLRLEEPKMFYGASNLIFENAKALRNRVTESESLLWGYLSN